MDILEQGNPVVNRVSETHTAPEVVPKVRKADLDPETLGFAVMTSKMMLEEAAETAEGVIFTFEDGDTLSHAREMLESCASSVEAIVEALPTPADIVADVYWKALERLGLFDLTFDDLAAYHASGDGDTESEVSA